MCLDYLSCFAVVPNKSQTDFVFPPKIEFCLYPKVTHVSTTFKLTKD